ncbi:MAG TPA: CsgG/HfaB family protein [Thermoanaerobaculia bacterium]|nr:CsgG/HfaB family protein [Thermoanaerobaculia bacterium]
MKSRILMAVGVLCLCSAVAVASEKPSVGVADFTNDTAAGWWYGGAGRDLSGMLANELSATDKFRVVERSKLAPVLEEQDLGASGRVSKSSAAKVGKLTGARYLVMGTVSSFQENVAGGGGGFSFRGVHLGGKKQDAYIAVDLRVVDTTTGEVMYTRTVEARSESHGINVGLYRGGFGGDLAKHENTPAGKAIRACLIEISDYLSCVMVDKDSCIEEYKAKDSSRREKDKKAIKIE